MTAPEPAAPAAPLLDAVRQPVRRFHARARIAELMALGGRGIHRELAAMDRSAVEDIAVEALGVFAALGDYRTACQFWRRYAETGKTR